MRGYRKTKKNLKLFEILDDMQTQMTTMDENFYIGKPNRLDKLEVASHEIEVLSRKMQEHIQSMRRK